MGGSGAATKADTSAEGPSSSAAGGRLRMAVPTGLLPIRPRAETDSNSATAVSVRRAIHRRFMPGVACARMACSVEALGGS